MLIRKAEEKDIPRILELLGQVLQIHADIRPDIFIPESVSLQTVSSKWFLFVFISPSFCSFDISEDIAARSMQR